MPLLPTLTRSPAIRGRCERREIEESEGESGAIGRCQRRVRERVDTVRVVFRLEIMNVPLQEKIICTGPT